MTLSGLQLAMLPEVKPYALTNPGAVPRAKPEKSSALSGERLAVSGVERLVVSEAERLVVSGVERPALALPGGQVAAGCMDHRALS